MPSVNEKDWFKSSASQWTTNGKGRAQARSEIRRRMVHVEWADEQAAPVIEVTSNIKVRDRAIDLSKPGKAAALSAAERKLYLGGNRSDPDRRHRQGNLRQDREGRQNRSREGPRDL